MILNEKTTILYKISSNTNIIAVDMAIKDEMIQRKILTFGSTVWINILGKKKKNLGILYPRGRKEFASFRQNMNQNRKGNQNLPRHSRRATGIGNRPNGNQMSDDERRARMEALREPDSFWIKGVSLY